MAWSWVGRWRTPLLLLVPLLAWGWVRWGIGFDGLYGQDSFEYLRYATALRQWWLGGADPGWHAWPVGYGLTGALLSLAGWEGALAMQGISALALVATLYATRQLALLLQPQVERAVLDLYLLLGLALAPLLLRADVLVMSDLLALGWMMAALLCLARYREAQQGRWVALFALCAGLAMNTRYATLLPLLPAGLYLGWQLGRARRSGWLLAVLAIVAVTWIPHLLLKQGAAGELFHHYSLTLWSLHHWFERAFVTGDGYQSYRLPNLLYALYPLYHPALLLGGPLLLLGWRRGDLADPLARLLLAGLLLYLAFIAGIPLQNQRFLILAVPLVLLLLLPAALRLWYLLPRWARLGAVATALLFQLGLTAREMVPLLERNRWERALAAEVASYPAAPLYTFDVTMALRARGVPEPVIDLWLAPIEHYPTGAYVLFNAPRFARQWQGHRLMQNWDRLQRGYQLETLFQHGDGWTLYRITGVRHDG